MFYIGHTLTAQTSPNLGATLNCVSCLEAIVQSLALQLKLFHFGTSAFKTRLFEGLLQGLFAETLDMKHENTIK